MSKESKKELYKEKEAKKWRNLAIIITFVGVLVVALPWDAGVSKVYAAIPIYVMFVYVYYKYIGLRKAVKKESGTE